MSRPSRILSAGSLGRALAEVSIIVVGVLIALGADSWREAREEDRLAESYRAALLDDLVADSILYAVLVESRWFDVQAEAVDSLIGALDDPGRDVDARTAVRWLSAAARVAVGAKTRITFDDLSSSGRLSLLGPTVRRRLIAYHNLPIVLDRSAYQFVAGEVFAFTRVLGDLLGPGAYALMTRCGDLPQLEGETTLASPAFDDCMAEGGGVDGLPVFDRLRADPRVPGIIPGLHAMRYLGRSGARTAQEQAAALRALLRAAESEAP